MSKSPPKRSRHVGPEPPINAAIRRIAAKQKPPLLRREIARDLYVSLPTVFSWFRKEPTKAPKMALALLCLKYKEPFPPELAKAPGRSKRP